MYFIFSIILIVAFFAIPYYGIRRTMTKKKQPATYTKIKKRIWYALALFIVGFIGIGATASPSKSTAQQHPKTSAVQQKETKTLKNAKLNVDSLFEDSKHTKLAVGISYKEINSIANDVNQLKQSTARTKLKKDILKAKQLWPAFKAATDKKAALASSKLESEQHQRSESKALAKQKKQESESIATSESIQRVADAKAASESVVAAQAASESARQSSIAAASESARVAQAQATQAAQTPTASPAPPADQQGATVYITATGSKYHYNPGCRGLNHANGLTTISLSDAISRGYTACKWG